MTPDMQRLVLLYAGMVLVNALVSAVLWYKQRDPLRRAQFFLWATTVVAFVTQGVFQQNQLTFAFGYSFVFFISLSIAQLMVLMTGITLHFRVFFVVLALSYALSCAAYFAGAGFFAVGLPVSIGAALPSLYAPLRVITTRWRAMTITTRGLAMASLAYSLHMLDFCVLGDKPQTHGIVFTVGALLVFTLSIFVPAAVIEQSADQQRVLEQDKVRLETELELAHRIQVALVPDSIAEGGYSIAGLCRPAMNVGGDCFDIIRAGQGAWVFVGDVSGHGVPAGLIMMMTQTAVRSAVAAGQALGVPLTPKGVLDVANRSLRYNVERIGRGQYVTATALRIEGDRVSYAGLHQDILVYRAQPGKVERVETGGIWLGVVDDVEPLLDDARLELAPGDVVLLHTDGISEAKRGGTMLGAAGLAALFEGAVTNQSSAEEIVRAMFRALEDAVIEDDATLVAIRRV